MTWKVREIRSQFPALQELYNGTPAVFCDGPGGSQMPASVFMAMQEYLSRFSANSGGQFETSLATDQVTAEARNVAADLLGASSDEIIFGANMTTLTYMLSRSIGQTLVAGDEIILSKLDHEANISPWLQMANERNLVVRWMEPVLANCTLDLAQLQSLISRRTKLIAVGMASNFSGSINAVQQITAWGHEVGAMVYVDAVHFAPHGRIDVRGLDCDFLVTSAYKHFGPHLGILFGKERHLKRLPAYQIRAAPSEIPGKFETGTLNFEALAGLIASVDYLAALGGRAAGATLAATRAEKLTSAFQLIRQHEVALMSEFLAGLDAMPFLRLYGSTELAARVPTFALRKEGATPRDLAELLARKNIFAWDGNFYALAISQALGVEASGGVLRIGFLHYNTSDEVQVVLQALDAA